MEKLLVITKKWKDLTETKFLGKAKLVGELENGQNYLIWDFKGNEDEARKIFGEMLVKVIEIEI